MQTQLFHLPSAFAAVASSAPCLFWLIPQCLSFRNSPAAWKDWVGAHFFHMATWSLSQPKSCHDARHTTSASFPIYPACHILHFSHENAPLSPDCGLWSEAIAETKEKAKPTRTCVVAEQTTRSVSVLTTLPESLDL